MVVLDTSDPNGQCFVMTANLDGETNLKVRKVQSEMKGNVASTVAKGCTCQCELPNNRLSTFEGTFTDKEAESYSLGAENVLLRGTQLRNTDWVRGVVVYTGSESKIQMNGTKPPHKFSTMTKLANMETLQIFLVECLFCILSASLAVSWNMGATADQNYYIWGAKGTWKESYTYVSSSLFGDTETKVKVAEKRTAAMQLQLRALEESATGE